MTSLKRSALLLIIALAIFFNLERLDIGQEIGQQNLIDISSDTYLVGLVAVIAILFFKPLRALSRPSLLLIWLLAYLGVRLISSTFLDQHPMVGDIYTYITITEGVLIAILMILAQSLGKHLDDFEEAIRNITLADMSHRVQHVHIAHEDIQRELLRSRRHNDPLSVMVIEPDPHTVQATLNQSVLEVQQSMMTRYILTNVMRIASHTLRRTDMILDNPNETQFVVICPETDYERASELAARLQGLIQNQLGVSVNYGVSSFPNEALTFEELVQRAELRKTHVTTPDKVPTEEVIKEAITIK